LRHRFTRYERLKSQKTTKELFDKGSSVFLYPFKLQFIPLPAVPLPNGAVAWPKVLVSVSKRNFKRANQRNRIRRRIREGYRLHKDRFFGPGRLDAPLAIGIVYVAKSLETSKFIHKKLIEALHKLVAAYRAGQPVEGQG
jgi:ribonuclease P protein component